MSMLEHVGALGAAARAVQPAISLSRMALKRLRLFGTFDVRWLELGDTAGMTFG